MRVALVSRELYPLGGGGIGQFVASAATLLSRIAEVTVLTTSLHEPAYRQLRAAGDQRLPPASVRLAFVPEPGPEEAAAWSHVMHCYAGRVLDTLRELYADGPPDLIEFPDFLGEGFVTLQAAAALDPFLSRSTVCVRLHTSGEICDVLDGFLRRDRSGRALHAMERYSLANADQLIWQGGDILGAYQRFYGRAALAPATRIRYPYREPIVDPGLDVSYEPGSPLRILYAGRLERRKGVHRLVQAMTGYERDDLRLTLVGGDTDTAPLGGSMRASLELAIAEDHRIALEPGIDRGSLAEMIRAHDVVAIPSLWECWPYSGLEALHLNRPLLATPVGGLSEMVQPGRSGWLTRGSRLEDLEDAIESLAAGADAVRALIRSEAPRATGRALSDDSDVLDGYQRIFRSRRDAKQRGARPGAGAVPLVSAIVPYYRAAQHVRATVASLLAQTYPRIEVVIVNDGSFDDDDWVLAELTAGTVRVVTQMNQGLGSARNFGIAQSSGRYVFPLDADNCAEPEFVARCVEILERRPEVAYVTSWSRYIASDGTPRPGPDLGYEPLGDHAELNRSENVAGDAAAVIRRRVFDAGFAYSDELASYEDWFLYRQLARAGMAGVVIPERLIRYRVRVDSMQATIARPRHRRLTGEIEAHLRESEMRWESSSA